MKIAVAGPISIETLKPYITDEVNQKFHGSGGASISNLIVGLLELGHTVSAYALDPSINGELIIRGRNLTIYIGRVRRKGRLRMKDFFEYESRQIKNFILKDKPDIINAHWSYEFAIGAIRSRYPHLITFRDHAWTIVKYHKDLYRTIRYIMNLYVMLRGKHFSVNSFYLYNKIGIKKNCTIIPNPILEKFISFKPKNNINETIKIISILNGFSDRKNPKTALKAFQLLNTQHLEKKFEYHIFGHEYEVDGIAHSWAKENGLTQNVTFNGKVEHATLMSKINDYDLLFHPSKEESFGNIIIEAMAGGLPVVAGSKSGAVPWLLKDGEYGILTDVYDEFKISKDIYDLVTNNEKFIELSKKGFDYIKENFSSRKIAEKYVETYKKILTS